VRSAAEAEEAFTMSQFTAGNAEAQRVLVDTHGVIINQFPEDVVKAAFAHAQDVLAETAALGDLHRRIYESWSKFRADSVDRAPYAEQGYMNNRSA